MQVIKALSVKILSFRVLLILLCIPPLSIGIFSYRPTKLYKCIRVIDGDTVILMRGEKRLRVRLVGIDAPESSQRSLDFIPIGYNSKKFLENLILNKRVWFISQGKGYYGRDLGEIVLGKRSVNLLMLRKGQAVSYYGNTESRFAQAEYMAKLKRLGIWETEGFLAPWKFRKLK